jgi:hypothetical protein
MAIYAATGDHEDGFRLFDDWSKKWPEYDAENTRKKRDQYETSPPTEIGAGTLFHLANEASPGWRLRPEASKRIDDNKAAAELGGIRVTELDREVAARRHTVDPIDQ